MHYTKQQIESVLREAVKKGYIKQYRNKKGEVMLKLTKKGDVYYQEHKNELSYKDL